MAKARKPVDVAAVAAEVAAAAKYRPIAPSLVDAVAYEECPKAASHAEAVKRVKRRLHQAVGAYLDGPVAADRWLAQLTAAEDEPRRGEVIRQILGAHASSRERLGDLAAFYAAIFEGVGDARRVVDLACGINPLARPLMPLPRDCAYGVFDAHAGLVEFVRQALAAMDFEAFGAAANLLEGAPDEAADVVLLLKALPCLAQLDPDAPLRLLRAIQAPLIVVSYPSHSLGGHKRGMRDAYRAQFMTLAVALPHRVEELAGLEELVFRLHAP